MIQQQNISFDTYIGRVLDPNTTSSILGLLNTTLNKKEKFPQQLFEHIREMCKSYVEALQPQNKGEYIQYVYLIVADLFGRLERCGRTFVEITNPKIREDYIILKRYLLPLIDMISEIHPKGKEYNSFVHDYLLNGETKVNKICIVENVMQPSVRIIQIDSASFQDYIKKNDLLISLSGCLFNTHEKKQGLFIDLTNNLISMRKKYKKKRDEYSETSEEYSFYDLRQSAIKIVANTLYGLYGLSTYRYSNSWLAKTITTQGRMTLKIAQVIGDDFLKMYAKGEIK